MQPPPDKEFIVRPCTHTALAKAYGVSRKVLYRWLKPHRQQLGPRRGYKYDIGQVLLIIEMIGTPTGTLD